LKLVILKTPSGVCEKEQYMYKYTNVEYIKHIAHIHDDIVNT